MLVEENFQGKIERIFTYPLSNAEDLRDPYEVNLNQVLNLSKFEHITNADKGHELLSNILTEKETGRFLYIHALAFFEKVVPSTLEFSKDRLVDSISSQEDFSSDFEDSFFIPVLFVIYSYTSHATFFYDVLLLLYKHFAGFSISSQLGSSFELLKSIIHIQENLISPPNDSKVLLEISRCRISAPVVKTGKLSGFERGIAYLVLNLNFETVLQVWEVVLLNNQLVLYGSNDSQIFLSIESFKQLIFPMDWNLNLFSSVDEETVDLLGCITPFIAGVNKSKVKGQDFWKYAKNVNVLDLDSGELQLVENLYLCQCRKTRIFNELTLAKIYFLLKKVPDDSLKFNHLEEHIKDQLFIEKIKKMTDCQDFHQKEKKFVKIIKNSFFKFFEDLKNLENFIEIDAKSRVFRIKVQEFLETIQLCNSPRCSMLDFYKYFINTQTFQNFLYNFQKIGENNLVKFKRMNFERNTSGNRTIQNVILKQKMHSLALIEILAEIHSARSNFESDSFRILYQQVKEILIYDRDFFDSSDFDGRFEIMENCSLIDEETNQILTALHSTLDENLLNFQMMYGKHGFFRLSKVFFQGISQNDFSPYLKKYLLYKIDLPEPDHTIIKVLLHLKHSSNLLKIFSVVQKLNEYCKETPELLSSFPSFHAGILVKKLLASDSISQKDLQLTGGHLFEISKHLKK